MSEQAQKNCCDKPGLVQDTKLVVFSVDNAAHFSKKLMKFTAEWCPNCKAMIYFSYKDVPV